MSSLEYLGLGLTVLWQIQQVKGNGCHTKACRRFMMLGYGQKSRRFTGIWWFLNMVFFSA